MMSQFEVVLLATLSSLGMANMHASRIPPLFIPPCNELCDGRDHGDHLRRGREAEVEGQYIFMLIRGQPPKCREDE